jgi:hypothetical protein
LSPIAARLASSSMQYWKNLRLGRGKARNLYVYYITAEV